MTAIERAYQLARTGNYANFTQIKKAMRREFNVDYDLAGKELAASLTRACKAAQHTREYATVVTTADLMR